MTTAIHCPSCHAPVGGAPFCSQCGTRIVPPASLGVGATSLGETGRPRVADPSSTFLAENDRPVGAGPVETWAVGHVVDDRYLVVQPLGRGAMGQVFRVHDKLLSRDFALKRLHAASESHLQALAREVSAALEVNHPNLMRINDIKVGRTPYLIMELLDGGSLEEFWLSRGRKIPVDEAADIVASLLDGLAAIHARGLVHLDVKPANVLRSRTGDIKLADFGISRSVKEMLGGAGRGSGTPGYMAPEQFRGEVCNGAADVYATAIMLYQLVSGRLPFDSAVDAEKWHTDPNHQLPATGTWLDGWLEMATETDAVKRPAASELSKSLRARAKRGGWLSRVELEARARAEAEAKARSAEQERIRLEAEAKARAEAKIRIEAEERARAETEAYAWEEAERARRKAEQERLAREQAKREADERARAEAERARKAREQAEREKEERARQEAESKRLARERAEREAAERAEAARKAQEAVEQAERERIEEERRQARARGDLIIVAADGTGDARTPSEALAKARDNATIDIAGGEYLDAFRIERPVTIRALGDEEVVIKAPGVDHPSMGHNAEATRRAEEDLAEQKARFSAAGGQGFETEEDEWQAWSVVVAPLVVWFCDLVALLVLPGNGFIATLGNAAAITVGSGLLLAPASFVFAMHTSVAIRNESGAVPTSIIHRIYLLWSALVAAYGVAVGFAIVGLASGWAWVGFNLAGPLVPMGIVAIVFKRFERRRADWAAMKELWSKVKIAETRTGNTRKDAAWIAIAAPVTIEGIDFDATTVGTDLRHAICIQSDAQGAMAFDSVEIAGNERVHVLLAHHAANASTGLVKSRISGGRNGIVFRGGTGSLEECEIAEAEDYGVWFSGVGIKMSAAQISRCSVGAAVRDGTATITDTVIEHCRGQGLEWSSSLEGRIASSTIRLNAGKGIDDDTKTLKLESCRIESNGTEWIEAVAEP